jgi:hypothetical protein
MYHRLHLGKILKNFFFFPIMINETLFPFCPSLYCMVCECISLPSLTLFLELVVNSLFSHIDIWQWGRWACVFPKLSQEICLLHHRVENSARRVCWFHFPFKLHSTVFNALCTLIRHFDLEDWQSLQKSGGGALCLWWRDPMPWWLRW